MTKCNYLLFGRPAEYLYVKQILSAKSYLRKMLSRKAKTRAYM